MLVLLSTRPYDNITWKTKTVMFVMILNQESCSSGNAVDMYFRHAQFESWPGQLKSLMRFCGFPQSFQANTRMVPQLGYDWLLSYSFQYIIHL
jgi:hypothetical protein